MNVNGEYRMDLADEQWAIIEPLIPEEERQASRPGRHGGMHGT